MLLLMWQPKDSGLKKPEPIISEGHPEVVDGFLFSELPILI
jgi:hypothetical protein